MRSFLLLVMLSVAIGQCSLAPAATYSITAVGETSGARKINNSGQIVVNTQDAGGNSRGFIWTNGVMQDIGTLGGVQTFATDISDNGLVTGISYLSSGSRHAFLYDGTTMYDLGTLPGATVASQGYGVNTSGQVVGTSNTVIGQVGVVFTEGAMQALPTFAGSILLSYASDINSSGQIVGQTRNGAVLRSYLLTGGVTGTLVDLGISGKPNALNDSAMVVGQMSTSGGAHAFRWSNGVATDLGTIVPGYGTSEAYDINSQGHVVGVSTVSTGVSSAQREFYYDGSIMRDLNSLIAPDSGWVLTLATGVNDLGQIVGTGTLNGVPRGFLLTPVPEPATISLAFCAGAALLALTARKRRSAR